MVDRTTELEPASIQYRLLRIANDQFGTGPTGLDEQQYRQVRSIAAKEYLIEQAVLSSAEAADIVVPQSQVDKAAEQIAARYGDEETFYQELGDNNLRISDLKTALERELRVEAVLALVSSRAPLVEDTEVDLFYYMNRDRFHRPELRTARHILVTVNPQFPENTPEEAARRLQKIRQRIVKKPSRFAEQAAKHSECPSSMQGGLLGDVKRDTLYPELGEVLFTMRPGEVSEPVESPMGLHLLFCEAIQPEGIAPLADIIDKLRQQLQEKQAEKFTRRWIQSLVNDQDDARQQREKSREIA